MPKQRHVQRSDVLKIQLSGDQEENFVSKSQSTAMLQGKGQVDFAKGTLSSAFGGLSITIYIVF